MPNMPQCQSGKVAETQRTAGCRLAVPLANDNRALVVDTVNLKDILCDIEADPDRGHGDLSLNNNAAPPILSEAGSAVAEGVYPIWIRTCSTAARKPGFLKHPGHCGGLCSGAMRQMIGAAAKRSCCPRTCPAVYEANLPFLF